ncbi:hypothetical protein [Verminephrobacter eiseniae]|uniref:hypothetical protein n=1 Tax=Verminephrobacter eiseniae TaxID=364317 RepID=UPI0022371E56|nr:hypothetical protein [Verminephrobacter eiseniae]
MKSVPRISPQVTAVAGEQRPTPKKTLQGQGANFPCTLALHRNPAVQRYATHNGSLKMKNRKKNAEYLGTLLG